MGVLFQRLYDPLMAPLERHVFGRLRRALLRDVLGDVLEVGAGTGVNFPLYGTLARVTAIEPAPAMLAQARQRAASANAEIRLVASRGETLPFADNSFDTVVVTLVFCTVADPMQSLTEIRRVLKPGGRLRLLEHVRAEHPVAGWMMDWATPAWARLCDGCHLNRRTQATVQAAGFELTHLETRARGLLLLMQAVNRK